MGNVGWRIATNDHKHHRTEINWGMSVDMRLSRETAKNTMQAFWKAKPQIYVVLMVVGGIAALGLGYQLKSPTAVPVQIFSKIWFGDILWALGKLSFAGGVIAAFLRIFHALQILEKALEKFMVSDGFLGLRNDLDQLWVKITARIYLKSLDFDDQNNQEFLEKVQDAISKQFEYENKFYLKDTIRSFDIYWKDVDNSIIKIEETQDFICVPIEKGKRIVIENKFRPNPGREIGDYTVENDNFEILDKWDTGGFIVEDLSSDNLIYKKYTLSGQDEYHIKRSRTLSWSIELDRFYEINSQYICDKYTFICNCFVNDIRTTFIEFGMKDRFRNALTPEVARQRIGDERMVHDGLLLPGNGFAIFFEKV